MGWLLIIALAVVWFTFSDRPRDENQVVKNCGCPPHDWHWNKVMNEDGTLNHEILTCSKCGPLHGVKDE